MQDGDSKSNNKIQETVTASNGQSQTDNAQELTVAAEQTVEVADTGTATTISDDTEGPAYNRSLAAEAPPRQMQLTRKEMVSLKHHNYKEAVKKFDKSFVVLNKRTGMVVEMRAASAWHAITMISWKHKHCRILQVIDHTEEKVEIEEVVINSPNYLGPGPVNQAEVITLEEEAPEVKKE